MIQYKRAGGLVDFFRMILKREGSVFCRTAIITLPCALISCSLKLAEDLNVTDPYLSGSMSILMNNAVWSGFTFLVSFLIVFRTSQAYARFWDSCTYTHHMRSEWFDACSALIAFCKAAKLPQECVTKFQQSVVTLFSLLHAVALAELEDTNSDNVQEVIAFSYPVIALDNIDGVSLKAIRESESKVELVYQWIQQLVVENLDTGMVNIPAPLLSRVFQEMANGMVQFHQAIKVATIPFPWPYAQTCDALLLIHWLVAPVVISQWVARPEGAFIFTFMQVFIVWSLRFIATELENPFGLEENDIDARAMQLEINRSLLILVDPDTLRTPKILHSPASDGCADCRSCELERWHSRMSLKEVWSVLSDEGKRSTFGTTVCRSGRLSTNDQLIGGHKPRRRSVLSTENPTSQIPPLFKEANFMGHKSSDCSISSQNGSNTGYEFALPKMPPQHGALKPAQSSAEASNMNLKLHISPLSQRKLGQDMRRQPAGVEIEKWLEFPTEFSAQSSVTAAVAGEGPHTEARACSSSSQWRSSSLPAGHTKLGKTVTPTAPGVSQAAPSVGGLGPKGKRESEPPGIRQTQGGHSAGMEWTCCDVQAHRRVPGNRLQERQQGAPCTSRPAKLTAVPSAS